MKKRNWIIITIVFALAGYSAGRFFTKPQVVTKTVEVIKEVEVVKRDVKTVIKEIVRPDGTKETRTVIKDRTKEETRTETDRSTQTKVTNLPQFRIRSGFGYDFISKQSYYPVGFEKRFWGPVSLGLGTRINNTFTPNSIEATVSLDF